MLHSSPPCCACPTDASSQSVTSEVRVRHVCPLRSPTVKTASATGTKNEVASLGGPASCSLARRSSHRPARRLVRRVVNGIKLGPAQLTDCRVQQGDNKKERQLCLYSNRAALRQSACRESAGDTRTALAVRGSARQSHSIGRERL
jgi:hypothetical protein